MAPKNEEYPCKRLRLFGPLEEAVTLVVGVGDQRTNFVVHKNILCAASPFFTVACKPKWMKSGNRVIPLPTDDPEIIQMMVYWLYHNEICVPDLALEFYFENQPENRQEALDSAWGLFAQLYVVGKKYQIPRLQVDAIDALLELNTLHGFVARIIPWVYENTTDESDSLRALIFRIARLEMSTDCFEVFESDSCAEFLFDMAYKFAADRGDDLESEITISLKVPKDGFCAELHAEGGCDRCCTEFKKYIVINQNNWKEGL